MPVPSWATTTNSLVRVRQRFGGGIGDGGQSLGQTVRSGCNVAARLGNEDRRAGCCRQVGGSGKGHVLEIKR